MYIYLNYIIIQVCGLKWRNMTNVTWQVIKISPCREYSSTLSIAETKPAGFKEIDVEIESH